MEEKVLEIIGRVLELDNVEKSISSANCEKWDSMAQLDISVELESAFGVTLEPEDIGEMASFDDIIRILNTKLS